MFLAKFYTQVSHLAYLLSSAVWPPSHFLSMRWFCYLTGCVGGISCGSEEDPQIVPFHRSEVNGKCKTKVDLIFLSSFCVVSSGSLHEYALPTSTLSHTDPDPWLVTPYLHHPTHLAPLVESGKGSRMTNLFVNCALPFLKYFLQITSLIKIMK